MSRSYNKSYQSIFQAGSTAKKLDSFRRKPASPLILKQAITEKSTILIVDISGYSQFVKQTVNPTGANVISSLLGSIIRNNTLGFQISEIEGDAILFYKYGAAQPVMAVLSQFEQMLAAFNERMEHLKINCPQAAMLSIKWSPTMGQLQNLRLNDFTKSTGRRSLKHTAF